MRGNPRNPRARRAIPGPDSQPATVVAALLVLAFLVLGISLPPSTAATAQAAEEEPYDAPLAISIDSLSPSTLPRTGVVRVTGEVTNIDDVEWVGVNVYSILGDEPMSTVDDLATAADSDPRDAIGERIVTFGTFDKIGEIPPGKSRSFSMTVPRSELDITEAGIYWFGVHALGSSSNTARDLVADGRARTFLPYIPEGTSGSVKTALVVPLRRPLDFSPNGSLADPVAWREALASGGRLRDTLEFGSAAGSRPVTWLVDPALPDAVARLASGNPGRSIAPTISADGPDPGADGDGGAGEDGQQDEPTGDPPEAPEESPIPDPAEPGPAQLTPEQKQTAAVASAWLTRLEQVLSDVGNTGGVLRLPYGDLDVSAAAGLAPEVYQRARSNPGAVLAGLDVAGQPVISSPNGYLDPDAFGLAEDDTTVLVTDQMFDGSSGPSGAPAVASIDGRLVGVTSSGFARGGPGPNRPLTTVGLRQRLISEAAVRLLSPDRPPLVAVLPPRWRPQGGTSFFSGLDQDWLELTTVDGATEQGGAAREADTLDYPAAQQRREADADAFAAASALAVAGETLQNLLTMNDEIAASVSDQSLSALSYGARRAPAAARTSVAASRAWIDTRLGSVGITSPSGVTLASTSGEFGAVVENRLNQPVTVDITAEIENTDNADAITVEPITPIRLGADARESVNLTATARDSGVHDVRLLLTDVVGNRIGGSDSVPIRSSQVSNVIWVILGTGIGLFLIAGLARIRHRGREERSPTTGSAAAETEASGDSGGWGGP